MFKIIVFCLLSICVIAENINFRSEILKANSYLVDPVTSDDLGVALDVSKPEEVKHALEQLISINGKSYFKGKSLYLTGIDMRKARQQKVDLQNVVRFLDIDLKIHVLSIPSNFLLDGSVNALENFRQRLVYGMPSITRHYQTPLKSEVVSGIASGVLVEAGNIAYLFNSMPIVDATMTVTSHAFLIVMYSVYKKFMVNWLLAPGAGKAENFIKQMALSLPFVVSYNIFGNFTAIKNFMMTSGLEGTLQVMPQVLSEFATTQSLTILLQTLFYQVFINNGIRAIEGLQHTAKNVKAARVLSNFLTVPVLMINAVAFTMASTGTAETLFTAGPLVVNTGHAALALLTAVGLPLAKWPHILQPTVKAYRMATSRLLRKKVKRNCVQSINSILVKAN